MKEAKTTKEAGFRAQVLKILKRLNIRDLILALVIGWLSIITLWTGEAQQGSHQSGLLRRLRHGWVDEDRGRRQLSDRFEGDIILDSPRSDPSMLSAVIANPEKRWPSGKVEYHIYHTIPREHRRLLVKAMDYVTEKVPCVTFAPKREGTINYVDIQPGPGCDSVVGMQGGGKQDMLLNAKCFNMPILVHELLHTLGFVHEQNRPDRDNFVSVNLANVDEENHKNFNKRPAGDSYHHPKGSVDPRNSPYDVLSVMHYGPNHFSNNGEPVLSYIHGLPDPESWEEPPPEDPMSLVDQVELALAYGCEQNLTMKTLIGYIHRNRNNNGLRIGSIEPQIKQIKTEVTELKTNVLRNNGKIGQNERSITQNSNKISANTASINKNSGSLRSHSSTLARLSMRGAQCGYRREWTAADSTITYEKMLLNVGRGSMDLGSGVWTAQESGLHQVVWSLRGQVHNGEFNRIYLYKSGWRIDESVHISWYDYKGVGYIDDQGGRTMMLELQAGDTLELKTDRMDFMAHVIHFCVSLLHAS